MQRVNRRGPKFLGMNALSIVGHEVLAETSKLTQGAFGDDFETLTVIFVRKKSAPEEVHYFGAPEIPFMANLIGELSRQHSINKILGK